jgi:hypothetical protein
MGVSKRDPRKSSMRTVVEVPEPHGRTERDARAYVINALAALDDSRTPRDATIYWGERVKSFDRVHAAVTERPIATKVLTHLAEAMVAVAGGHEAAAVVALQTVLKILGEKVGG